MVMATTAMTPAETPTTSKASRGKDQIHWSEGVWKALDHAVMEEMMRTRVAAKFLPHVHVDKKQTTVAQDVVIVPGTPGAPAVVGGDVALSVDEAATFRIQEYWTTFKLSVAQVEAEEHQEMALSDRTPPPQEPVAIDQRNGRMSYPHRASTAVSLAMRTANILAQAEDLTLINGQNAVVNSPLFNTVGGVPPLIQFLDLNLKTNLDLGLLNISPTGNIVLPFPSQVIPVHPSAVGTATSPPQYAENTLNAVASAFSVLQGLGHYEHYAAVLHTIPYADLHQALKATLIEPIEPVSHLIKAGIYGTGTLPPFTPVIPGPPPAPVPNPSTGLPKSINGNAINFPPLGSAPGTPSAQVLYTGVLVSLSGNTMDHVRGRMEEHQDVIVTFNQKDANEQYRFRVVQRFALRLKDPTAVIVLLFLDS
jgi:hypothetical protein